MKTSDIKALDDTRKHIEEQIRLREKAIDRVMKEEPGPKRWRAAAQMMIDFYPEVKQAHQAVIKECAETREYLKNPYGTTGDSNSGFRNYMRMPGAIKEAIERADPLAFKKDSNAKIMFKTFPEYQTSEIY